MHLFVIAILQIIISQTELQLNANEIADHYWRDYTGRVPGDAIEAGKDKVGHPIYIGQAFFKGIGLLPTTIYLGSGSIKVTARGEVFSSDKNIKILCSQHPERYRWVPTEINKMHLLVNCILLPGGTETQTVLYIGRVNHELALQVGKIFPNFSEYRGLALPHNNGESNYKTFEVLAYNCSALQYCECA